MLKNTDFDIITAFFICLLSILIVVILKAIKIVPQQQVWIVERMGKYYTSLNPGLNIILPFIDKISYKHNVKEIAVSVPAQSAITKDNVTLSIDGILYLKIIHPVNASYGAEDVFYAVTQLAQTAMRSAIGKINLDNTFEERETLNMQIVTVINEAASTWGIQCMRYEIKDIKPPQNVLKAMETQIAADRQKRADILESEGKQRSMINLAEGQKQELILKSEGYMQEKINQANAQAQSIKLIAEATAQNVETVAKAIIKQGGEDAISFKLAEQYIKAFESLAKSSNTMIVPSNTTDVNSTIASALTIFKSLNKTQNT